MDFEALHGSKMVLVDDVLPDRIIVWKGGCTLRYMMFNESNGEFFDLDVRTLCDEPESYGEAFRAAESWLEDLDRDFDPEDDEDYDHFGGEDY